MGIFDDIDKRFRAPPSIKLERPEEGDPCPAPKCGGHLDWQPGGICECYGDNGPCRACEQSELVCTGCGECFGEATS